MTDRGASAQTRSWQSWSARAVLLALLLPVCASARLPAQSISVNQNPVRVAPVVLHWTPVGGAATVEIFTLTGDPVLAASLPNDPGRYQWDLTATGGGAAQNGAYIIVVTLSDNSRLRRRLLVAR